MKFLLDWLGGSPSKGVQKITRYIQTGSIKYGVVFRQSRPNTAPFEVEFFMGYRQPRVSASWLCYYYGGF